MRGGEQALTAMAAREDGHLNGSLKLSAASQLTKNSSQGVKSGRYFYGLLKIGAFRHCPEP